MDEELIKDRKLNEPYFMLSKRELIELLYFIFESGFISYGEHEAIHELNWRLKVEMDKLYPNWTPANLRQIVKEVRKGD